MSLKHAILGFLSFHDLSGYDLKKALDASVQHFWHADQSQIYRTLRQLYEEGCVQQQVIERADHLDRKLYRITEAGRKELHRWLSTPLPLPEDHDPFLIQVYFGGMLSDEELLLILNKHLENAEEQIAVFEGIHQFAQQQAAQTSDLRAAFCALLTLEYGAHLACTVQAWLLSAIERVSSKTYQPEDIHSILTNFNPGELK